MEHLIGILIATGALGYMFVSGFLVDFIGYCNTKLGVGFILLAKIVETLAIAFVISKLISVNTFWVGALISLILATVYVLVSAWSSAQCLDGNSGELPAAMKVVEWFAVVKVLSML